MSWLTDDCVIFDFYTAKAVQPANAKHLAVGRGLIGGESQTLRKSEAFSKWLGRSQSVSLLAISAFSYGCYMPKAIQRDEAKRIANAAGISCPDYRILK